MDEISRCLSRCADADEGWSSPNGIWLFSFICAMGQPSKDCCCRAYAGSAIGHDDLLSASSLLENIVVPEIEMPTLLLVLCDTDAWLQLQLAWPWLLQALQQMPMHWNVQCHDALVAFPGYIASRRQMDVTIMLSSLKQWRTADIPDTVVLALTSLDIFCPPFSWLFGAASPISRVAVVSLYRLQQSISCLVTEIIHEIGHCFALRHCPNKQCAMSYSRSLFEVKIKSFYYCSYCAASMRHHV